MSSSWWHRLVTRLSAIATQFMFGASMSWVMASHAAKRRAEIERLFVLMTGGDLIGLPIFMPRSKLQLLPCLMPQILYWRRRLALWDDGLEGLDLKHIGHRVCRIELFDGQ